MQEVKIRLSVAIKNIILAHHPYLFDFNFFYFSLNKSIYIKNKFLLNFYLVCFTIS